MKRFILAGVCAVAALGVGGLARAQAVAAPGADKYPTDVVRIVVPYTPGGATDAVARSLATRLGEKWGKPVIVDNRGGASGIIGTESVAKAPKDGYTLVLSDSAPFVILPALYPKLGYAPLADFAPVSVVARQVPVVVASTRIPATNIKELLVYLKAHPETAYASLGSGSYPHVAMEDFQQRSGTRMIHVPYKGTAQVMTDMIGGEIGLYIGTLGAFQQQEKAGKVRILAVATEQRVASRPDLPTVSESGVPGFSVNVWFGLLAPAGTPPDILDKIHRDVGSILGDKAFVEQSLTPQVLSPGTDSRAEFGELIKSDTARWGGLIKAADIKL